MPVVLIGTRHHVGAALQSLVHVDRVIRHPYRSQAAGQRAERLLHLFRLGRSGFACPRRIQELLFLQVVVAPHDRQGEHTVHHVHQSLELAIGRCDVGMSLGEAGNGSDAGGGESLDPGAGFPVIYWFNHRDGAFLVGPVVAVGASDDPVLAGVAAHHELNRLRASHGPGGSLDIDRLQTQSGEDSPVGAVVLAEADVQALLIDVEGVGVFHRELAHTQ